jgi:putative hydrolase of the HAD superfamily
MTRAVIFDLGGTLMSFGDPALNFRELTWIGLRGLYDHLCESNHSTLPGWEPFKIHLDESLEAAWRASLSTHVSTHLEPILTSALARWSLILPDMSIALARFHVAMRPYIRLYDDTLDTLEEFRRRGLKIGLISNTIWPPELHDADLRRCGILEYFDHRLYSSVFPYVKPHPAIFQASLAALQVQPAEAAFVGDRIRDDVGGAQAVGMTGILKLVPERDESSETVVPDARIRTLRELWALV